MAGAGLHPYHQQWTTAAVAPPPPAMQPPSAPPPAPPAAAVVAPVPHHSPILPPEEVRTIFISGLPDDVKERELQNMLRWLPGYEASQVNYKGEKPMGFALFSTPPFAVAAKDNLQGLLFDVDMNSVLHTEMAKKNLFVKRGIVVESGGYDQSKRMRTGGDYTHPAYVSPSPFHPLPAPVWGPHGYMAPPPPPYDPYTGYPVAPVPRIPMVAPPPVPAPSSYLPVQNIKDNPPCNTLFIGNLGESINEDELRGLFSVQPGFKQMKVLRQERHTVCFFELNLLEDCVAFNLAGCEFCNERASHFAGCGHTQFRFCRDANTMYSKNPFGKRKDGIHPAAGPGANGTPTTMTFQ